MVGSGDEACTPESRHGVMDMVDTFGMEEFMTCYLRHLGSLFEVLDLEYDAVNRKRVDAAIREALGLTDADHCPQVWAAIKELPVDARDALPARVGEIMGASAIDP